jgi:hypothetical protein
MAGSLAVQSSDYYMKLSQSFEPSSVCLAPPLSPFSYIYFGRDGVGSDEPS